LKAHYPAAFMAAVLSSDMDNTDKVVMFIDECRDMQLAVELPNINTCQIAFSVNDEQTVLYGLGAIKGVGTAALEGIIAERAQGGPFTDLFDLCRRIDLRKANRRVLEALIRAGALDVLDPNRARSMASLTTALQMAEHYSRDSATGQNDLFGGMESPQRSPESFILTEVPEWDDEQRLSAEKETLGLYLSGHPIERYEAELGSFVTCRIAELRPSPDQTTVVAGLVTAIRTMNSRRGERIAFVTLDDRSGRLEVAVFAEAYQRFRDLLVKDRLLVVAGNVSVDDYTGGVRMSADEIHDIDQARGIYARRLEIIVDKRQAANGFPNALSEMLLPFREGGCPVWVNYQSEQARAQLALGNNWRVQPTDELLRRLRDALGQEAVEVIY
jgi:DNA polymerase-3 subunit alpha